MSEAVCIASGPSLTTADVELVRVWRERVPGRIVIVANCTFRLALWADCLFAMDNRWWRTYGAEAARDFQGKRLGFGGEHADQYSESMRGHRSGFQTFGNSGCGCLILARKFVNASKIVMLGYDCHKFNGKAHWHEDHPPGMGNANSSDIWKLQFKRAEQTLKGVPVINASRQTALKWVPRMPLEQALA